MKGLGLVGLAGCMVLGGCGGGVYEPGSAAQTPVTVDGAVAEADGFVTVDEGVELYYFTQGDGEPVLVIHGGPGYPVLSPWSSLEPLAQDYRFVYYHQRGCGESTRPIDRFESGNYPRNVRRLEEALGLATQIRDIEAMRIATGAKRVSLIGHSFGGFLAALYAVEYPHRVASLVLLAPAEVVRMPMKHSDGLYGSVRDGLPEGDRADYDAFMKEFFDYGSIFQKSEEQLRRLNARFVAYYAAAYGSAPIPSSNAADLESIAGWGQHAVFFSMGRRHDYTTAIEGTRAPTLIVTGADDLACTEEILDTYGRIPSARHVELPGGHFTFAESGEAFAWLVTEFLGAGR